MKKDQVDTDKPPYIDIDSLVEQLVEPSEKAILEDKIKKALMMMSKNVSEVKNTLNYHEKKLSRFKSSLRACSSKEEVVTVLRNTMV